jgi:hypothetical protein
MKVKSLCSFNRSSGRDGAVKTAIKLKTAPDIVPHHAAKSTIVRGALKFVPVIASIGPVLRPSATWMASRLVSDEIRELIEQEWPELVRKLPPKKPHS